MTQLDLKAHDRWMTIEWQLYRLRQDLERNTMKRDHYRAMIVRAVEGRDEDTIGKLVDAIRQAESAKSILRQLGYGSSGMTIDATARLVPHARDYESQPVRPVKAVIEAALALSRLESGK